MINNIEEFKEKLEALCIETLDIGYIPIELQTELIEYVENLEEKWKKN